MYARKVEGRELSFGVSGMLYRSNVLMYDHQTESLWLQVGRKAVTGPMTGKKLTVLSSTVTTWEKWRSSHPDTLVLSFETGYRRDYRKDPYEDYYRSSRGMFRSFFSPGAGEVEKEMVIGVEINGAARAYPLGLLREKGRIDDILDNRSLVVSFREQTGSVTVVSGVSGDVEIPHVAVYWFVWKGIYPESTIYR